MVAERGRETRSKRRVEWITRVIQKRSLLLVFLTGKNGR
jgi:hypothetical protein